MFPQMYGRFNAVLCALCAVMGAILGQSGFHPAWLTARQVLLPQYNKINYLPYTICPHYCTQRSQNGGSWLYQFTPFGVAGCWTGSINWGERPPILRHVFVCSIPQLWQIRLGLFSLVSLPKHPQAGNIQSSKGVTNHSLPQTGHLLIPALTISSPLQQI